MDRTPRRLLGAVAIVVSVALAALVPLGPAQAADTGSISGLVTARPAAGAAAPYEDALVVLDRFTDDDDFFTDPGVATALSDASGHFTVADLPDGHYRIRTYPDDYGQAGQLGQLGYEYYDDQWAPGAESVVVVSGGAAVTLDHTIELRPIGHVVGHVVDEHGDVVPGTVSVRQTGSGGYSTTVGADGSYDTLDGEWSDNLIPGEYLLSFSSNEYGIDAPLYYYEEKPATVTAGGTTTVDFTVVERPTVIFTVRDSEGQPVAEAPVRLWMRSDGGDWQLPQYGPIQTDEDGRFLVTDTADDFKLQFFPEEGGSDAPEYWDDADSLATATVLSFAAGGPLHREYDVDLAPAEPEPDPVLTPGKAQVTGTAKVGRTLRAVPGTWRPAPVTLSYQWLRDGRTVAGRTGKTYALKKGDAGHRISVRVTGRKASYPTVRVTSRPTAKVRR